MPLDIEAIAANPVQADEGTIELLTKVFGEAGTVTLDKAVSCAMPLAEDIDWIVEFGWTNHGQEAGLWELVDKALTGGRDGHLFCL